MSNKTEKAFKLIEKNIADGKLSGIDNPQELMDKLSTRYGDNTYKVVVDALTKPTEVMKGMGQEPTTSAKTLEYLAGDQISSDNIKKKGGKPGISSAYGDAGNEADDKPSRPHHENSEHSGNSDGSNGNKSSSGSFWGNIFDSFMNSDFGQMFKAALAIQLANQAALAWDTHYKPYSIETHPFKDNILHFEVRVNQREEEKSKTADMAQNINKTTTLESNDILLANQGRGGMV